MYTKGLLAVRSFTPLLVPAIKSKEGIYTRIVYYTTVGKAWWARTRHRWGGHNDFSEWQKRSGPLSN